MNTDRVQLRGWWSPRLNETCIEGYDWRMPRKMLFRQKTTSFVKPYQFEWGRTAQSSVAEEEYMIYLMPSTHEPPVLLVHGAGKIGRSIYDTYFQIDEDGVISDSWPDSDSNLRLQLPPFNDTS